MIGHKPSGFRHLTAELLATTLIGLSLLGPAVAQTSSTDRPDSDRFSADRSGTDFQNLLPLLLTSPDRKQFAENLEAAIRRGDSVTETLVNYRKDGSVFVNYLTVSPVRDAQQRLTHFVGVQTDVTAQKQSEDDLSASEALG